MDVRTLLIMNFFARASKHSPLADILFVACPSLCIVGQRRSDRQHSPSTQSVAHIVSRATDENLHPARLSASRPSQARSQHCLPPCMSLVTHSTVTLLRTSRVLTYPRRHQTPRHHAAENHVRRKGRLALRARPPGYCRGFQVQQGMSLDDTAQDKIQSTEPI